MISAMAPAMLRFSMAWSPSWTAAGAARTRAARTGTRAKEKRMLAVCRDDPMGHRKEGDYKIVWFKVAGLKNVRSTLEVL